MVLCYSPSHPGRPHWSYFTLTMAILTAVNGLEISLDPSPNVVLVNQAVYFNMSVDTTTNTVCLMDYGANDCISVLEGTLFELLPGSPDYYGVTNFTYNSSGTYVANFSCEDVSDSSEVTVNIVVMELLSNLVIDGGETTLPVTLVGAREGNLAGSIELTFETGSHLSSTHEIDNTTIGSVPANISERSRRISINFRPGDFTSFGYHTVNVTVFNQFSSESLSIQVLYEEEVRDLRLEVPSVVLVNSSVQIGGTVLSGSNLDYHWTISGDNGVCLWYICNSNLSNSSFVHYFGFAGEVLVDVTVDNAISSANVTQLISVLYPVEDFVATVTSPYPNSDLLLRTTSPGAALMGNLSITVQDDKEAYLNASDFIFAEGISLSVMTAMPQGDRNLTIRIYSAVSEQTIQVNISLWAPIVIDIKMNPIVVEADQITAFEITNSSGWGFDYVFYPEDGQAIHNSSIDVFHVTNRFLEYHYVAEGIYQAKLEASNMKYSQILAWTVYALFPVPAFTVIPSSIALIPPGELNATIVIPVTTPSPTNVTCVLTLNSSSIFDLQWDEVSSGTLSQNLSTAGLVNVSLNCTNLFNSVERSWTVDAKEFSLNDFQISLRSSAIMGDADPAVEVDFLIRLYDGSFIPPGTWLQWNFGDNSAAENEALISWGKRHRYPSKGQYNTTLLISVGSGLSREIFIPIHLGRISVETNITFGEAGVDSFGFYISGISGESVNVLLDYGDGDVGTCSFNEINETFVLVKSKMYSVEGVYRPLLVVSTALIVEEIFLPEITAQFRVQGLQLLLEQDIQYPDGVGSVTIFTEGPLVSKSVSCTIEYSDGSQIDIVSNVTGTSPYIIQHTYSSLGIITVTANCSNLISFEIQENSTTMESSCFGAGMPKPFRDLTSPLVQSLSEPVTITADITIMCNELTSRFFWTVTSENGTIQQISQPDSAVLQLAPRTLISGTYVVRFLSDFAEMPVISISDNIRIEFQRMSLQVSIKGGNMKTIGQLHSLDIDAISESYDPDIGFGGQQNLNFAWYCSSSDSLELAQQTILSGALTPCPSCVKGHTVGFGLINAPAKCLVVTKWHAFVVNVTKDERKEVSSQIVHVVNEDVPLLELRCKVNCLDKQNVESPISYESECLDCDHGDISNAVYGWTLYGRYAPSDPGVEVTDFDSMTSTGTNLSTISILPNSLVGGAYYRLQLDMHLGGPAGSVSMDIYTNLPPYGRSCTVTPTAGNAALEVFQLECTNWKDEGLNEGRSDQDNGDGLSYQFMQLVGNQSSLIYWGDSSKPPAVELNVGSEDNDYSVTILVRVFDKYNGVNDTTLSVRVSPPLSKDSGIGDLMEVSNVLQQLNTKLEQSTAGGDIKKSARFIESAASVINTLVLPLSNSTDLEDPGLWLGAVPMDLAKGNGTAYKWTDMWKDYVTPKDTELQDILTQEMTVYIENLAKVVNKTAIVSLETVYYVSSTLNILLKEPNYVSNEGVKSAVDTINHMTNSLDTLLDSDVSETEIIGVVESVFNAIDSMVGATLPQIGAQTEDINIENIRRTMEAKRKYEDPENLAKALDLMETADLLDDERVFFMTRATLHQEYAAKKKRKLAKEAFGSIQKAMDQSLDAAVLFLVVGQPPIEFRNDRVSASVEKILLRTVLERTTQTEGILFSTNTNDKRLNSLHENPEVGRKVVVYHSNPFVWDEDATSARITSPTVEVKLSPDVFHRDSFAKFTSVRLVQKVVLPNPSPVVMKTLTPEYIQLDRDQLLYHRMELASVDESIVLFLRPTVPHVQYDVYFRSGEYPTSSDYDYKTMAVKTDDADAEDARVKITCPRRALPSSGTVYYAIKPNILEVNGRQKRDVSGGSALVPMSPAHENYTDFVKANYGMAVTTVDCKLWETDKGEWNSRTCSVADSTTETATVCLCETAMTAPFTLATSFVVPVNTIDFSTVFAKIDLLNNASVFATILSVLGVYALLAVWARNKDKSDVLKWGVTPLIDNSPQDRYLYIVTVYTGMRLGAGTHSRVGFAISAEDEETGVRQLYDGIRNEMPRQSVMNFLMAVPYPLGDLQYVRIWHDDSGGGDRASWFPHKLVIEDIQMERRYIFPCDRWLAVDKDDGKIDRILPVSGKDNLVAFQSLFNSNLRLNVTDIHLWLSVLMRPQRSHFTRLQRLSCCLSLLFLTMITSAMFYRAEENIVRPTMVNLGFLRFSFQQVYVSVISILIVTPASLLIVMLFKKSKPRCNSTCAAAKDGKCSSTASCFPIRRSVELEKLEKAMIVTGFQNPKEKMLPHYFVYAAWVVLFVSVALPGFFLFLYSQQWGKTKSEEWLTSFIMSFFESLLVVDPIKVVLLAAIFAMCIRKPSEIPATGVNKSNLGSNQDKVTSAETNRDSKSRYVGPLQDEAVTVAREARRKVTTALSILKEVILYVTALVVIFTLGYSNRDPRSSLFRENIHSMMIRRQPDKRIGLTNVVTKGDFFKWVDETAFPVLFYNNYYQGTRRHWRERCFLRDWQNYRVGPPRMRQVRSPPLKGCTIPQFGEIPCHPRYDLLQEEINDFCIGWGNTPCPDEEVAFKLTSQAWKFTSSIEIWGLPVWGQFNTYSGGGYIAELDVNFDVSAQVLKELFSNLWIERQTRAVTLEFTLYNANANMFCYVTLVAEFPETGGTLTKSIIQPFRAYHHTGALGAFILFNEILFLIFLAVATVKTACKLWKEGRRVCHAWWNIMDILCLIACYCCIAMYLVREAMVRSAMKKFNQDPKKFVNFLHITVWDELFVSIVGIICFFCTLRMIKILGYNKRINGITAVIVKARKDLLSFGLLFFILFSGFVILGYTCFGNNLSPYSTILTTAATLTTSMIGKTPFDDMRRTEPILAQVYFAFFVFFVVFILLTMFLAILNESIEAIRKDESLENNQHELLNILMMKIKESIGIFKPNHGQYIHQSAGGDKANSITDPKNVKDDSEFALKVLAASYLEWDESQKMAGSSKKDAGDSLKENDSSF